MQVIPVIFHWVGQRPPFAWRAQLHRLAHVRRICALADLPIQAVEARGGVFAVAGLQRAGECRAPFVVKDARIGGERRKSRQGQAIVGLAFLVAFLGWSSGVSR